MMRGIGQVLCVGVVLCAGAAWAQLDHTDQKCVNAMNKDTSQIQAAKGKLDAGCVKNQEKGKELSADGCITADAHGKVSGAIMKQNGDNTKHCASIPSFAYETPVTSSSAAVNAEENLLHDMVGNPADSGLFPCDPMPLQCACQLHVIPRVENLIRTLDAEFVRCKVAVLAVGKTTLFPLGAASASDLAHCITDGSLTQSVQADPKMAFSKAVSLLVAAESKFCSLGEFNAGACSGNGAPLDTCLVNHAKCRFCQMANAADGLAADCGTFSGITCP